MKEKDKQATLFEMPEWWEEHWQDMPEFVMEDHAPFKSIYVHFRSLEDMQAFQKLIDQRFTTESKFIWFPESKPMNLTRMKCIDAE